MNNSHYVVSVPVRLQWKNETGELIEQDGLTESIGRHGALVYLPRQLPGVGSRVVLTVECSAKNEIEVPALVVRLDRNFTHPKVSLKLTDSIKIWKRQVWAAFKSIGDDAEIEEF